MSSSASSWHAWCASSPRCLWSTTRDCARWSTTTRRRAMRRAPCAAHAMPRSATPSVAACLCAKCRARPSVLQGSPLIHTMYCSSHPRFALNARAETDRVAHFGDAPHRRKGVRHGRAHGLRRLAGLPTGRFCHGRPERALQRGACQGQRSVRRVVHGVQPAIRGRWATPARGRHGWWLGRQAAAAGQALGRRVAVQPGLDDP